MSKNYVATSLAATKAPAATPAPVITSYSIAPVGTGFAMVTTKSQGKVILEQTFSEPGPKAVAVEAFKLAAARTLIMG